MRYRQPYTLYKRGKYWYFKTYSPDGKRTAGTSTGKTSKSAAREFCDKLYLQGSLYSPQITLHEYAAHFFDDNSPYLKDRSKPLKPRSIHSYRINLQNLFEYAGDVKLCDINYTYLRTLRGRLLEYYKPSSVIHIQTVLGSILKTAVRDNIIVKNPMDLLEPLEEPKQKRDGYRLEEVFTLVEKIDPYYKSWIIALALTGMRISEYVGVRSTDIKKHEKGFYYIDLKRQWYKDEFAELKRDSKRPVPIIPELLEYFDRDVTKVSTFYRYFVPISRTFENEAERLLCVHSLRHFFISNAKANNVNKDKVETLAGHVLHGEEKTYTHFSAEDLTDILEWQRMTYDLLIEKAGPGFEPNPAFKAKKRGKRIIHP